MMETLFLILPEPLHSGQGVSMILPDPPHWSQVFTDWNCPKGVLWTVDTCPDPPHLGHVFLDVPGLAPSPLQVPQATYLFSSMVFLQPNAASSKVMEMAF